MRIINQSIPEVAQVYKRQNELKKSDKIGKTAQQDEIKLSSEARFFNVAKSALQELPETREEKIAELREAIQSGTYDVNLEELAEKIWWECFA